MALERVATRVIQGGHNVPFPHPNLLPLAGEGASGRYA
jgi:hypothetical protein